MLFVRRAPVELGSRSFCLLIFAVFVATIASATNSDETVPQQNARSKPVVTPVAAAAAEVTATAAAAAAAANEGVNTTAPQNAPAAPRIDDADDAANEIEAVENDEADADELEMQSAMENELLFEGDIVPDSLFLNAMNSNWKRWPNGAIPYVIDRTSAPDTAVIIRSMENYHNTTCIRFIPRTSETDYIRILKGQGCYSMVGRVGGEQPVSIGRGCAHVGTVVHEFGHAIGFYHEHTRSDRDQFIKLYLENVDKKYHPQFRKLLTWQNWLITPFDFDSVMLYGSKSFSKTKGQPSMTRINGDPIEEVYNRQGMSSSDIERVNTLYKCNKKEKQ